MIRTRKFFDDLSRQRRDEFRDRLIAGIGPTGIQLHRTFWLYTGSA